MGEAENLDFSSLEGVDDIDWSDVEGELQRNREMLIKEAKEKRSEDEVDAEAVSDEESTAEMGIDFLYDVPLKLTVEIGRTRMLIKDLLNIDINSIIELRKKIGIPMNVLINEKIVAKGEIMVQDEKFGLKILEILDQNERIKKLQEG